MPLTDPRVSLKEWPQDCVVFGELDIAVSVDWHQNLDYRPSLEGWEETMNMDNFSRSLLITQKEL